MNSDSGVGKSHEKFNPWPVLLEALLICVVGAALGLGVHYRLVLEVFQGGRVSVVAPAADVIAPERPLPPPVAMEDVVALLAAGAVPVDARARELYVEGHLPGARSLPVDEVDSALGPFMQNVSRKSMIIVYCSGYGCPDSENVAVRLAEAGYVDVVVYEGGFPEWRDAGLPVETGGRP